MSEKPTEPRNVIVRDGSEKAWPTPPTGAERNARNREARRGVLLVLVYGALLLAVIYLVARFLMPHAARAQEPPVLTTTVTTAATTTTVPPATPTPVLPVAPMSDPTQPASVRWLDRSLLPLLNYLGQHPVLMVLGGMLALYALYMVVATAFVWAFKVRFSNDRTKCSFRTLVIWNLLEATGGAPWILIGRTARHYWPIAFKPWESDTGEGKLDGSAPRPLPDTNATKDGKP